MTSNDENAWLREQLQKTLKSRDDILRLLAARASLAVLEETERPGEETRALVAEYAEVERALQQGGIIAKPLSSFSPVVVGKADA